jgi:putative holliday junction resolvase
MAEAEATAGRTMALDVGDRRIGVAVTDPMGWFARPLSVLTRVGPRADMAAIAEIVAHWDVVRVVVGLPLLPSGDRGEQAEKSERFAAALERELTVPVELWDESYTTVEAEARRAARGVRPGRSAPEIDAEAAAVILEEWLAERRMGDAAARQDEGGSDEPDA